MFKVKRLKFFPHKCLLPVVKLNEGVNKSTRRKYFFSLTKIKVFMRYFLSVRNFPNKFSSSSCGSLLGVEFHIFLRFKNLHRIARIF